MVPGELLPLNHWGHHFSYLSWLPCRRPSFATTASHPRTVRSPSRTTASIMKVPWAKMDHPDWATFVWRWQPHWRCTAADSGDRSAGRGRTEAWGACCGRTD